MAIILYQVLYDKIHILFLYVFYNRKIIMHYQLYVTNIWYKLPLKNNIITQIYLLRYELSGYIHK